MFHKRRMSALVLGLGLAASAALAPFARGQNAPGDGPPPQQPGGGGPGGGQGGPGGPGGPGGQGGPSGRQGAPGGLHLIPRFAEQQLNLTDDQKKQVADLEKETKEKLAKILTPEQMKTLEEARPPRRGQGGQGGGRGGQGGPGAEQGGPGGPGGGPGGPGGGQGGPGGPPPQN